MAPLSDFFLGHIEWTAEVLTLPALIKKESGSSRKAK
jgi:hypothetical protein